MQVLSRTQIKCLIFSFFLAGMFFVIKYFAIFIYPSDYPIHIDLAKKWFETGEYFGAPHFLFQLLVVIAKVISRLDWTWAGLLVDLSFYGFLSFLICREFAIQEKKLERVFGLTFFLILSWPLFLLVFQDNRMYGGYIGTNVFHNPTMVILKPLALYVHFQICKVILSNKWSLSLSRSFVLATMVILSALAKPNYAIVLLPALAVILLFESNLRNKNQWFHFFSFIILPVGVLLAIQFLGHYVGDSLRASSSNSVPPEKTSIIFAPFAVFQAHSQFLFAKFVLSVFFPLTCLVLFKRSMRFDIRMRFTWLCFFIGAFYSYFLAESGRGLPAGNFGWSSQITLFILFVESALFLIDEKRSGVNSARKNIGFGVLIVHALFGFFAAFMLEYIR